MILWRMPSQKREKGQQNTMGSMPVPGITARDFASTQYVVPEVKSSEELLREDIGGFTFDPTGLVDYIFPWGIGQLEKYSGPRTWQGETLQIIKDHLADELTRYQPLQLAVASGHGIGKTALIAMIMEWAQSTCEDCKIVVTAGTGTQLATKTVPEVQKWFRLAINSHWWDINATSIRVKDEDHQAMWRTDFITWSLQKTEAFAGLHNIGKRIILIFDEASAIADQIWEVAEGALTDEDTEIIWIAFGNPTRKDGKFYEAITGANRWKKRQIDSRTVEGTNKTVLDAQIKEWGEDSDRARVRIKGEFPRGGSTQFISGDLVAAARKRIADGYQSAPVIISVDVARFGDDRSVILLRQGRKAEIVGKYYGVDTQKLGGFVVEAIEAHSPDAVVIDGDGIGGAVVDYLTARRYNTKTLLHEFHGGATAHDAQKYFNRRSEIWGDMRDWLEGGQIPDEPEVETDLTGPDYGYHPSRQCLMLESKDEMKSRGVDSPDIGDALAMSFAVKVLAKKKSEPAKVTYPGQMAQSWMS